MGGLEFLIIIPIILIVLALAWLAWKAEQKRHDELAALARRLGFRFNAGRDRSHDERYSHFEVFRRGHSRCALNVLTGEIEHHGARWPVMLGDFEYKITTSNGKTTTTTTYRFSFCILHLPFPDVPDVLIRPEGLFDRLKSIVGFDDIDFESAEFSRAFYVASRDRRFAYDLIDPRMMEFLMTTRPPLVDMEQGRILLADGRTRWSPQQFETQLQWALSFLDHWPRHVVDALRRR